MFNSSRFFGLKTAIVLAVLLVLGMAGNASAVRHYQMSGSWLAQRGQAGIPLQFVLTQTTTMGAMNTGFACAAGAPVAPNAVGKHNCPLAFPNPDIMGVGVVSATGSGPASLTLPQNIFNDSASLPAPGFALNGTKNVQITTNFTMVQAPGKVGTLGGSAMFAKLGGPGDLIFCPKGPWPLNPGENATTCPGIGFPPQGSRGPGVPARNGRVIIEKGANQFGGVMQMFLQGSGLVTRPRLPTNGFGAMPFQAAHNEFGGGGGMLQVGGGAMVNASVWAFEVNTLQGGPFTQPLKVPGTMAVIPIGSAGPKLTSPGGLFTACPTMFGTNLTMCTAADVGPNPTLLLDQVATTTNTGFPFTTGKVFAQNSTNPKPDYFTVEGSDMRTAKGVGQITLVAGGLSIRQSIAGLLGTGSMETVVLTMAKHVPSMSKTGFAAAAALMVLAVGYAFRRRF